MSPKQELLSWDLVPHKLQEEIKDALKGQPLSYYFELGGRRYLLRGRKTGRQGILVEPVEAP